MYSNPYGASSTKCEITAWVNNSVVDTKNLPYQNQTIMTLSIGQNAAGNNITDFIVGRYTPSTTDTENSTANSIRSLIIGLPHSNTYNGYLDTLRNL